MRTTTPRRLLATVLAPVAALSLAACGGGDDDNGSDDEPASSADLVVTGLDGIRWDKDAYTASAGGVVIELRNDSSLPHTLRVVDANDTQIGAELNTPGRGDTDDGTFSLAAGTYRIICTVAGHGNMNSELTVS